MNGVNLGNWLVLERWMKPGIFAASGEADEIWLHRATKSAELEALLTRHRDHAALFGIEVLNEPIDWLTYAMSPSSRQAKDRSEARGSGPIPMAFLKRFYRETYHRLRPILAGNQVIVFHDGFRLGRWRDWFVREGMRGVMLDTHVYLVMAEQFPLFRLIPDRWLMGWYRLFVRWNERRIRRAARYTPVIVGEWCVANNLVNRTPSARNAVYREVAAMQRKAWSASAGQIYWSYQLRGNRAFLPTIDPQSDTSRLDPWDLTHVWHAGWMAGGGLRVCLATLSCQALARWRH
ncbi:hypothetical protein [Bifidobacterium longum]|uniref:hypothetical protein n=1 Tax=Bifidobacterium longum TaxID=216816 RepID=UPI001F571DA6|nr:hypothetical protein [Bifidobacterium longum]